MSAKHKGTGPQSLTANELREGLNVWLDQSYEWSIDFKDALLSEDEAVIERMQAVGERDSAANIVVAAYFIDVDADTRQPVRYREKFRVSGPTHDQSKYPDFKKA